MSMRPLFAIPWLIGFTSMVLLAYVGFSAWNSHLAPAIWVEVPDLVVDNATVGINTVEYIIVNDGAEAVQLLGGDAQCFANCCFGPKLNDLPTIPPGGRVPVPYELSIRTAGEEFAAESTLFLQCHGRLEQLKVTVSGKVSTSLSAR